MKCFLSNAPETTAQTTMDHLATSRWSIEQCFQECKSYLRMGHYETSTYNAWHCQKVKKTLFHNAHDKTFSIRGVASRSNISANDRYSALSNDP
ncbi:hypothetical protein [Enterococcus sp. DIV0187]|uniref:hypothetical protein n=1 Tax=Enterococcus sp. DIV0187 TaxID=2774644 RepID=UPI003F270E00